MGSAAQRAAMWTAGEAPAAHVSLLTNGVTWYLRSSAHLEAGRLEVVTPRTLLGFIPVGSKRLGLTTARVRRIALGTKLYPDRLVVAVGLALLAIFADLGTVGTVLVAVATVAMLLLSLIAVIRIDGGGERSFIVPICLAHIPRARRFAQTVEQAATTQSQAEP